MTSQLTTKRSRRTRHLAALAGLCVFGVATVGIGGANTDAYNPYVATRNCASSIFFGPSINVSPPAHATAPGWTVLRYHLWDYGAHRTIKTTDWFSKYASQTGALFQDWKGFVTFDAVDPGVSLRRSYNVRMELWVYSGQVWSGPHNVWLGRCDF